MRRRARETFVLGAERVLDEAELDLRNQAEADLDSTTEEDHPAPAEPAIAPDPPAGPTAGAETSRASSSGSQHWSRRPRPSVRTAVVVVCALGGLAGLWLWRGADRHGSEGSPTVAAIRETSPPAVPAVRETTAEHPSERPADDRHPALQRRRGDHERQAVAHQDPSASTAGPAERSSAASPPTPPPAPIAPAAPTALSVPADSSPTESTEPVQSAASVRREFGP